ncbi:MAG TPA: UbiA family prenyltransferase [Candidatus Fimivivens sp.]|nr:UbiA family prenyltransferase [Candidatus Fimivivens sp.]
MKKRTLRIRSMMRVVDRSLFETIESIETTPLSLGGFTITFLAIILVRLFVENGTNWFVSESLGYVLYEFSHTFLFFLFSFLLFLPIVRLAGASSWLRATNVLLVGFLIIWTPPVIDKIVFGDQAFWSFYQFDGIQALLSDYFHFFGGSPSMGITYGVRAEVAFMSLALGCYTLIRLRKPLRALGIIFLSYTAFFILGTFPSYVAIAALASRQGLLGVTDADIAGYMISPRRFFGKEIADPRMSLGIRMSFVYAILAVTQVGTYLYVSSRRVFMALLRNVRWPQAFWHGGLLFLGGGLAMIYAGADPDFHLFEVLSVIVMIAAIESAWIASVIGNDLSDRGIDAVTNPMRPLVKHAIPESSYRQMGILFFSVSILFSAIVSLKAMMFLLAYQAIAWIYSMPPLRLKRVPVVATSLSAAAGIAILLSGYSILSPVEDIVPVPFPLLSFLFVCYAITLPLKDFKDIEGDKKDGVRTIPVILGEERARTLIGSALFACYVASPVVLHEVGLLIPSVVFGSLAFLTVRRAGRKHGHWGSYRALPGWNMLLVTVYGIITTLMLLA